MPPPSESQIFPRPQAGPRVGQDACCEAGLSAELRVLQLRVPERVPVVQVRAGSYLRVVRAAQTVLEAPDPPTHGDERPSASGCCARVLDGAGGLVGVRDGYCRWRRCSLACCVCRLCACRRQVAIAATLRAGYHPVYTVRWLCDELRDCRARVGPGLPRACEQQ